MTPSADIMPHGEPEPMVRLVIKVPVSMRAGIQREADRRAASASQIVRDAILAHLPTRCEQQAAA